MKWEYKLEAMKLQEARPSLAMLQDGLNVLGEDGWEAVSLWHVSFKKFDKSGSDTLILFKRPISK